MEKNSMEENNMERNNANQNNTEQNNTGQNGGNQDNANQNTTAHSGMEQEDRHLSEHFFHIGMLLHRYQTEAARENDPMGSPYKGQGRILAILKLKPEISHRELSYPLGISTQSMNELLRKLESKGYVKRVPSEQDRRSMNIVLTEEGKKAVDQAGELGDRDAERLSDCFSEGEKERFRQYLERLEQAIIGQLDPGHAKEYTFERMKEMHDYILAQNPRERVRSHHHIHGMGMDGSPKGERATRGERQEGPFHGEGPQGPFYGGFGRGPANDEDEFRRRFGRRRQMGPCLEQTE